MYYVILLAIEIKMEANKIFLVLICLQNLMINTSFWSSDMNPLIHPFATFCMPQFKSFSFREYHVEALLGSGRKLTV